VRPRGAFLARQLTRAPVCAGVLRTYTALQAQVAALQE
jgi:hypothetical protein